MQSQDFIFRDPTRLTKLLKFFLHGCLIFATISIIVNYSTYVFFMDVMHGLYPDQNVLDNLYASYNHRQELISFLRLFVLLGTGLSFALWIYQANKNCRALGAVGMRFTPGWCIGWFFVPILNMWMPYKAIHEIWQISSNVKQWSKVGSSGLVKFWWASYLINNIVNYAALKLMLRAEELSELADVAKFAMLTDLLAYPLSISAILMIEKICVQQMIHVSMMIEPSSNKVY